jgi:opine dehydrogenase
MPNPGAVRLYGRNRGQLSAGFPAEDTEEIVATLKDLCPSKPPYNYRISPAENVLAVTLCDSNAMHHPPDVILNLGRVESPERDFNVYLERGKSPSINKVWDALERERLAVMAGFDLKPVHLDELRPAIERSTIEKELYKWSRKYVMITSVKHRFLTEDIPFGLVTIASLADAAGVATPIIDALINISCVVNETDYWKTGRTLEKLGLKGMSRYEIRKFVEEGAI